MKCHYMTTILANSFKITANPVQSDVKQPSFLDSTKPPAIDFEVAVEDSFGRVDSAEIRLAWNV